MLKLKKILLKTALVLLTIIMFPINAIRLYRMFLLVRYHDNKLWDSDYTGECQFQLTDGSFLRYYRGKEGLTLSKFLKGYFNTYR